MWANIVEVLQSQFIVSSVSIEYSINNKQIKTKNGLGVTTFSQDEPQCDCTVSNDFEHRHLAVQWLRVKII